MSAEALPAIVPTYIPAKDYAVEATTVVVLEMATPVRAITPVITVEILNQNCLIKTPAQKI